MAEKFELSENLNKKLILVKKNVFGQISGQTSKKVIFSDFGDMYHCGLPGSQAMGMMWVS